MSLLSSVEGVLGIRLVIFYSTADYTITAWRNLILFAGGCWARRQLPNGIRYVSVASKLRNSLSSAEGILGIQLAVFYWTADMSTATRQILMLFAGGCWAWCHLRGGIRYVSVTWKPKNLLFSVLGALGTMLGIFYSMADISTTTGRILIPLAGGCWPWHRLHNDIRYFSLRPLFTRLQYWIMWWQSQSLMADSSTTSGPILDVIAGGCWAWRQLRDGIRYVSVASKPMNPPTLLRVVFLQVPELNGRFLHSHQADSGSDCGGLLPLTPTTWWYRFLPPVTFIHEVTVLNGPGSKGGPGGYAKGSEGFLWLSVSLWIGRLYIRIIEDY